MNERKQISALFMLSIMLTMMMHNAFPHVHHEHLSSLMVLTSNDTPSHHHHHGHKHEKDSPSEKGETANILDFLFHNHSHSSHSHHYTHAPAVMLLGFRVFVSNYFIPPDIHQIALRIEPDVPRRYDNPDQRKYSSLELLPILRRGPPMIG
jgi:hypothetical protein